MIFSLDYENFGLVMSVQTLFWRTCNLLSNTRCLTNYRLLQVNLLPSVRGLKQETLERLKSLKVPEKPKRPATPYVRFVTEHRTKILQGNPNLKQTEIVKKCAEDWKSVTAEQKEKYIDEFKSDCAIYNQKILSFNANLSAEQKEAIHSADQEKRSDRKKRKMRKIYKETNKPKRPTGPYAHYIMEQSQIRNASMKDLMVSLKEEWAKLPEAEKNKYKNQFLREKKEYEEAMVQWEAKMLKEGKIELVRGKSEVESKTSRIKQIKRGKPQ